MNAFPGCYSHTVHTSDDPKAIQIDDGALRVASVNAAKDSGAFRAHYEKEAFRPEVQAELQALWPPVRPLKKRRSESDRQMTGRIQSLTLVACIVAHRLCHGSCPLWYSGQGVTGVTAQPSEPQTLYLANGSYEN